MNNRKTRKSISAKVGSISMMDNSNIVFLNNEMPASESMLMSMGTGKGKI